MSSHEFWEEEPELMWAYQKAYIDKNKAKNEIMNYQAWLNGIYIYDAVSKSLHNSFGKKGSPVLSYMQEPIDFSKTKEDVEKEKILKVEEQIKERNEKVKQILNKKKQKKLKEGEIEVI